MRASGILLPISSLPSRYGIGCFDEEAYNFIDQLKTAGQKYWQILPIGPIGYGDSPYQSFSTFAGNPYYIDLEQLKKNGWLSDSDLNQHQKEGVRYVDYGYLYQTRFSLLKKAYHKSKIKTDREFIYFCESRKKWLDDYALYMALKSENNQVCWEYWEDCLRNRDPEMLKIKTKELKDEIQFYKFLQFIFLKQWKAVKKYANHKGIKIIGDIPIYVSYDSADAWANKHLFQFDATGRPYALAGCPPDGFSATGQLWGNPLYDWDYHKKTNYEWWIQRLEYCFEMFDVVRIDHFRGFDEYYSIPYGDKDAIHGYWKKGPGIDLFRELFERLGNREVIAEDLGYVTDSVRQLVKDTGYPGMKIIEFAFDSRDSGCASDYLPHNYENNCVVYTGTHDNETITGWFCDSIKEEERHMIREYLCDQDTPNDQINIPLICLAMRSVANLCIVPMQDVLGYGNEARMNTPSTMGTNWKWRLLPGEFSEKIQKEYARITARFGR